MERTLHAFLYIAGSISLFALFNLTVVFTSEVNFENVVISLLPLVTVVMLNLIYLKERKRPREEDAYEEHEDGEIVNIFSGIPWSNKDGEYSEGVFFWYENNSLYTTLDFHMELGGDPDVFNEWLEQEKESPKYLQPTLQ